MDSNAAVMRLREILHTPGLAHWNEILDITEQHPFLVEYADSHIVESWPHTLRRLEHIHHCALPLVRFLSVNVTKDDEQAIKEALIHPTLLSNLTMFQIKASNSSLNWVHVLVEAQALRSLTHLILNTGHQNKKSMTWLWESGVLEGLRYLSLGSVERSWYRKIEAWSRETGCQVSMVWT